MGAWGHDILSNDHSQDFIIHFMNELIDSDKINKIMENLPDWYSHSEYTLDKSYITLGSILVQNGVFGLDMSIYEKILKSIDVFLQEDELNQWVNPSERKKHLENLYSEVERLLNRKRGE